MDGSFNIPELALLLTKCLQDQRHTHTQTHTAQSFCMHANTMASTGWLGNLEQVTLFSSRSAWPRLREAATWGCWTEVIHQVQGRSVQAMPCAWLSAPRPGSHCESASLRGGRLGRRQDTINNKPKVSHSSWSAGHHRPFSGVCLIHPVTPPLYQVSGGL